MLENLSKNRVTWAAIIVALVSLCAALWFWTKLPESAEEVHSGTPALVAVRDLARLQTVSFHMERVVAVRDEQERLGGLLQGEDEILLVAACDVEAGINLERLDASDVVVSPDGRSVEVRLPPAEIFTARLDNDRTYVYQRNHSLFATPNPNLESEARRTAERDLREYAIQAGILERARSNAEQTLRTLLQSVGFREVRFVPRLTTD